MKYIKYQVLTISSAQFDMNEIVMKLLKWSTRGSSAQYHMSHIKLQWQTMIFLQSCISNRKMAKNSPYLMKLTTYHTFQGWKGDIMIVFHVWYNNNDFSFLIFIYHLLLSRNISIHESFLMFILNSIIYDLIIVHLISYFEMSWKWFSSIFSLSLFSWYISLFIYYGTYGKINGLINGIIYGFYFLVVILNIRHQILYCNIYMWAVAKTPMICVLSCLPFRHFFREPFAV